MASSASVAPAPVQPAAAPESGPVGAVRFATPPDVLATPAVAAEAAPAVDPDPEPVATAAKEPKTRRHRWCGRCGRG